MKSDLDARERRAGQGRERDAAPDMDDQGDPFVRGDFFALTISVVILTFGIWWVTPW